MKTIEQYFYDWESHVFGYGYGTGEQYTLQALKDFLALCPHTKPYDYKALEEKLSPTVAWLMVNVLCKNDVLEYGSSPRYAWLTSAGRELKRFVDERTIDQLTAIFDFDSDYIPCCPNYCNCGPDGYEANRLCANPFYNKNRHPPA